MRPPIRWEVSTTTDTQPPETPRRANSQNVRANIKISNSGYNTDVTNRPLSNIFGDRDHKPYNKIKYDQTWHGISSYDTNTSRIEVSSWHTTPCHNTEKLRDFRIANQRSTCREYPYFHIYRLNALKRSNCASTVQRPLSQLISGKDGSDNRKFGWPD
jgi:hypothetical protein